jgi:hypothetical protein
MRVRTITFAASMLLSSAAFTSSFAQTAAVSEKAFDWIFFAIVGIPFVIVLFDTLINDGWPPESPEVVERRYPPTMSNAFAARPLSAWGAAEDEEVIAAPKPIRPLY